jgi:hypothetical protein
MVRLDQLVSETVMTRVPESILPVNGMQLDEASVMNAPILPLILMELIKCRLFAQA